MRTRRAALSAFAFSVGWSMPPPAPLHAQPWGEAPAEAFAEVPRVVTVPDLRPVEEAPLDLDTARAAGPLLEELGITLSAAQRARLAEDKFLLIPVELHNSNHFGSVPIKPKKTPRSIPAPAGTGSRLTRRLH